jgi:hypothetical protein
VQAARIFVGALSELSAGMQIGEHQLDCRHFPFGMNIYRNSAAVITHGQRSIYMDDYFYFCAKPSEMFVDRIVEHLENQMVQTPFIRVPNEHSRSLSNCLESFQFVDLRGVVFLCCTDSSRSPAR